MKLWLYALGMCQSMFCAIPFPWQGWEERARDRMLTCLPVIGLEIGLIWWGIGELCRLLPLPEPLRAAGLCAVPYLLTGFLHLDGFMDVTDAVRSCRPPERRREILKDSHVGSFAVIGVVLLIGLQGSACACLTGTGTLGALAGIPVVSRCCSVLAIRLLPPMQSSQYVHRQKHWAPPALMLAAAVGIGFLGSTAFGCCLLAVAAGFALALLRAYRSLGGMNGDISGYCISLSELAGVCALAMIGR